MVNILKKPYSWNKNYQTFHMIKKHIGSKCVKEILQIL
jgi:hypothetical protein